MAIKILFASQKGGVGKSTLARSLAIALAEKGKEVLIADFDTDQLTCVEWQAQRVAAGIEPDIEVATFGNLKKLDKIENRYDYIILDAPGFRDKETKSLGRYCDAVFLPTGVSPDDLRPTAGIAEHLMRKGIKPASIALILSRTGRSERQEEVARDYARSYGLSVLPAVWPQRDGFVTVIGSGRAGREASHPALKELARKVDKAMLSFIKKVT